MADHGTLLAAGASPDAGVGQHGAAPALMQAAKKGHTHVLEALLRAGATLGARDSGGSTALMWAARFGKPNCVAALLGLGADCSSANAYGDTALHHAAHMGELECIGLLLDAGADRARQNDKGETALQHALAQSSGSRDDVVMLLRDPRESGLADDAMPSGTRVRVDGLGEGVYDRFSRRCLGPNGHVIRFSDTAGAQTVRLRKLNAEQWSVVRSPQL